MMTSFDRWIEFEQIQNFRDIGGHKTIDNQSIKWNKLYRSAHLASANIHDEHGLKKIGIKYSIDLRSQYEKERQNYSFDFLNTYHFEVNPQLAQMFGQSSNLDQLAKLTTADIEDLMLKMYVQFVRCHQSQFSSLLHTVIEEQSSAIVHCTAGKDRTGFAIALILLILGVHKDDVLEDYLISNHRVQLPIDNISKEMSCQLSALWSVKAEYLLAALKEIDTNYQSLDRYVKHNLDFCDADRVVLSDYLLSSN